MKRGLTADPSSQDMLKVKKTASNIETILESLKVDYNECKEQLVALEKKSKEGFDFEDEIISYKSIVSHFEQEIEEYTNLSILVRQ